MKEGSNSHWALFSTTAYQIPLQHLDTKYACSVCHIRMCPAPYFQTFHTLENYCDNKDHLDADQEKQGVTVVSRLVS